MGSLLGKQMLSSEITNHKSGAKPLQPIKLGLLESWRLISLSYSDPLQHARHLNDTYGDVVMQKVGSMNVVHLFGVDASKLSLLNADNILSNKKAWDQIIGRLFPMA